MVRKANTGDFDFIYSLYMHPQVNEFLLYEMMDRQKFQLIFDQLIKENVLYLYIKDLKNIGMFKLIRLTHRTSHIAYLGGVALDPDYWGQHEGYKMMEEIILTGKEMGLKRMDLSTTITNERAIKLYEACGFQKEGVLRKYSHFQKEDVYLDEVIMAYLY